MVTRIRLFKDNFTLVGKVVQMGKMFFLILLVFPYLTGFAQDTVKIYLDKDFRSIEKEKAVVLRTAVMKNNHYCITDQLRDGQMINYCEYISINPFIENGLSKHYDQYGRLYAAGNYVNGRISGKWIYYTDEKTDTVDYGSVKNYFKLRKVPCEEQLKNFNPIEQDTSMIKNELIKFTQSNLHLPARTRNEKPNYQINVSLTVDTDRHIKCPYLIDSNTDFIYEALRVLLLYKSEIIIKKPVRLTIPVTFNIQDTINTQIFVVVEENATFQGGDINTFRRWVMERVKYPESALLKGVEGKVIVQFVVNTHGDLEKVSALRSLDPDCDAEAIRVIKSSPKWAPGKQSGKTIKQQFVLPIVFRLQNINGQPLNR